LVGAFFGRLIMAAVSRQREYLADASAVQFTRNPDGIGGALKKIGGLAEGSRIDNPQAAEAGHMFFAHAFARAGVPRLPATRPRGGGRPPSRRPPPPPASAAPAGSTPSSPPGPGRGGRSVSTGKSSKPPVRPAPRRSPGYRDYRGCRRCQSRCWGSPTKPRPG